MNGLYTTSLSLQRVGLLLLAICGFAGSSTRLLASEPAPAIATLGAPNSGTVDGTIHEGGIVPVGCASCGPDLPPPALGGGGCGPGGCGGCGCGSGCCYPGRVGCDCCWDQYGPVGRALGGIYNCICCPDPCYQPRWVPLANAGLFIDPTRPATQIRLRGDFGFDLRRPDKAEYFWAQENNKGPRTNLVNPVTGLKAGERALDYRVFNMYTEGAVERFSFFVNLPFINVQPDLYPSASGFGDMEVGTKSLLLDCELLQFAFQFRTILPTGNFTKGLGTGHTALEPSLLASLKLTADTYLQGQMALWIPVGGTADYEGNVFHYHLSLNHLLCNCGKDIQLIGTLECAGYEIGSGLYTDPSGFTFRARNLNSIFQAGGGLRLSICNKIDFGLGALFALTNEDMNGQELVRAEFRWRF